MKYCAACLQPIKQLFPQDSEPYYVHWYDKADYHNIVPLNNLQLAIYKFRCDVGRMGILSGIFVADKRVIAALRGKNIYFGEVLGKHSDIDIDLDDNNIILVSDKPDIVDLFQACDLEIGHNPVIKYFEYNNDLEIK